MKSITRDLTFRFLVCGRMEHTECNVFLHRPGVPCTCFADAREYRDTSFDTLAYGIFYRVVFCEGDRYPMNGGNYRHDTSEASLRILREMSMLFPDRLSEDFSSNLVLSSQDLSW